jgi:hypothetical protein
VLQASPYACGKCGAVKPPEAFRLRKSVSTGQHYRGKVCRACHQAMSKKWRHENVDLWRAYNKKQKASNPVYYRRKALESHYKRKYGLTIEQKAAILVRQGGRCAICQTGTPTWRGWCIDHCHGSGRIRAILCAPCNVGIGHLKHDPALLRAAAAYVEKHQ